MSRTAWLLAHALLAGCVGSAVPGLPVAQPPGRVAPSAPAARPLAVPSEADIGRSVVAELGAGEFAKVSARFDERMQATLPEAALRETWQRILQKSGAYVALGEVRLEERAPHRLVLVRTLFARVELETKVVLDAEGRIAGLFIAPLQTSSAEYQTPAYAEPRKFSEREVRVPDPKHPCASGTCGLPGTLTLPLGTGPHPALVLVHGSGPQDRDETLGHCRPFKDLAWGLATRGIAVLRYDKRTFFLEGRLSNAELESLTLQEETIDDALGAVKLLRSTLEVDPQRIFVLGHSQGGTALPRIGKAESSIAGFVSLAGSTRPLEDVVLEQIRYLADVDGQKTDDELAALHTLEQQVLRVKTLASGQKIDRSSLPLGIPAAYWLDLARHAPAQLVAGEMRPYLVLQGERDYQVTLADFRVWQNALAHSKKAKFKTYPKLNHAFISGDRPSTPADHQEPGHVTEEVVGDVAEFVLTAR